MPGKEASKEKKEAFVGKMISELGLEGVCPERKGKQSIPE